MASGWLIRPDLIVTAGHCAYDWHPGRSLGKAVSVKAYIGYYGRDSVKSRDVQFRKGVRLATTSGWIANGKDEATDVSFIQVSKPFTGIKPFQFSQTPLHGAEQIGVVGYPADKAYKNEHGARMYEAYRKVTWNLSKANNHLLNYKISTYPGERLISQTFVLFALVLRSFYKYLLRKVFA